jgi:periplasmic copper chaperone A
MKPGNAMIRSSPSLLLMAATLLWGGTVFAHDYRLGALVIGHPWARATLRNAPGGGAYLTIRNTGTETDRLISARSPASGLVQVNETRKEGDSLRNRELEKPLEIPPGGTVKMVPDGLHLLMLGLKDPLQKDTRVPLTLVFEKAGKIEVEMTVEGMDATGPTPAR